MALEYRFSLPLEHGLHARPASLLAERALQFQARITLTNERTGAVADAGSVLDLVAAGCLHGDTCLLASEGEGAEAAHSSMVEFISSVLPGCDSAEGPGEEPGKPGEASLPPVLKDSVDTWVAGIPAAPGLAVGPVVFASRTSLAELASHDKGMPGTGELDRFRKALADVLSELSGASSAGLAGTATDIRSAMHGMASDQSMHRKIEDQIEAGNSAATAVANIINDYRQKLASSGSDYLRERASDLEDIGLMLLQGITGRAAAQNRLELQQPSIVCAAELSTSQMLSVERDKLLGIVMGSASQTSHAVILARSFGVPVVSGVQDLPALRGATTLFIDGGRGVVVSDPGPVADRYVERNHLLDRTMGTEEAPRTASGDIGIELAANIASAAEARAAVSMGAQAVGLFRTELLLAAAESMPGEEEQYAAYSAAAQELDGRTLIIRTMDVGGDKPLPWLSQKAEANPFLGLRGIRLSMEHADILQVQLRSILRAASNGNVWVMAPMVSGTEEMQWFRGQVDAAAESLKRGGLEHDGSLAVGCMLEVPSAALQVRALAEYCDFFSIGSNDLCQYVMAVDRGNSSVSGLYAELHPSLLRLMKIACDEARACQRWIGICGEFASRPLHAPLLAGLGVDEASMSAPSIPAMRRALQRCERESCTELLEACISCSTPHEVASLLAQRGSAAGAQPMLTRGLVAVSSDSRSKAEAIRELCGLCLLEGRTLQIDALEDAVWQREAEYSTGLGYGIAIPHCKSREVTAASLAVLKLQDPVEWQSLDGEPVHTVILLAMPEDGAQEHLKVFARLARRLMNEDFRSCLAAAGTADTIVRFLQRELELTEE